MNEKVAMLDSETKVLESPNEHKGELRLWLSLLTCTRLVEAEIRRRLAEEFKATLPRFDLFAQLERVPTGMTLGELSRRMMVTNGNVTWLVDRLLQSDHLERFSSPNDRRVQIVKLTPKGRAAFARMAEAHEDWMAQLLSQISPKDIKDLIGTLGKVKSSIKAIVAPGDAT